MINFELESKIFKEPLPLKEKLDNINYLIDKIGILNFNQENALKYTKKNINPSIFVIKKIIENVIPNKEYLIKNFNPRERNSVSRIYENLFTSVIESYIGKKNYSELPLYLNYLILKSNRILEKFFIGCVPNCYEYSGEKNEYTVIKYICKNLDKLFVKYTNYGNELLTKLQMMHFYYLQPPIAKVHSEYKTTLSNLTSELKITNENKNLNSDVCYIGDKTNPSRSKSPVRNPFLSRLNQASDIVPGKNIRYEFVEKRHDYEYCPTFDKFDVDFFVENGVDKINLDSFYRSVTNFLNNYSPLEFPVFCLNFDYMRLLTSEIQNKIQLYISNFDSIEKLKKQIIFQLDEQTAKNIRQMGEDNYKMEYSKGSCVAKIVKESRRNRFESKLRNEKIKDGSISSPHSPNKNKEHSFKSFLDKQFSTLVNNYSNQIVIGKLSKKRENINVLIAVFNVLRKKFYFKKLKEYFFNKKIMFLFNALDTIDYNFLSKMKRKYFSKFLENTSQKKKIYIFMQKKRTHLKRKLIEKLKNLFKNIDKAKTYYRRILFVKIYYPLLKHYFKQKYNRKKKSTSRVYYYNKLISKAFQVFKYIKHEKDLKSTKTQNYDYSDVYDFFHGNYELLRKHEMNTTNELEIKYQEEVKIDNYNRNDSYVDKDCDEGFNDNCNEMENLNNLIDKLKGNYKQMKIGKKSTDIKIYDNLYFKLKRNYDIAIDNKIYETTSPALSILDNEKTKININHKNSKFKHNNRNHDKTENQNPSLQHYKNKKTIPLLGAPAFLKTTKSIYNKN